MKSNLSHLPEHKQRAIERITAAIHQVFDEAKVFATTEKKKAGQIEKIVLFGSYARGGWVEDPVNGFMSDYDLMVIVNQQELTEFTMPWLEAVNDRFLRESLVKEAQGEMQPEVNLIVHTLHDVNDNLALGRFFFCDILREGVLLYERKGSKPFAKPGLLDEATAHAEAKEAYEAWYPSVEEAIVGYNLYMERENNKDAAFLLHQAAERLYTCISLVFTLYSPKTHNLSQLRSRCEALDARLIEVWPRATRAERRPFNKLKEAYVKARYSKEWMITAEELTYIGERAKQLQEVTKAVCEERLQQSPS